MLAGVRWDYFDVSYDTFAIPSGETDPVWSHYDQQTDFFAPKASLIWEPTPEQTYYLSWATSASVPGQFPTNANATLGSADLEPEENESWELGGKFSVLDGRLGLSGAIFQIDKNNARQTDPVTGDVTLTGEEQRVRGIELGISGLITNAWSFSAAYAYLDSEVRSVNGDDAHENVGNHIANAPEHAASLWTTYNLSEHLQQLPGILLVGGGITYRDGVYTSSANTSWVPETFSIDLMGSYAWEYGPGKYRVAVNAYNVTDELNYSGVWGNRVVPASGRTFTLTLGAEF